MRTGCILGTAGLALLLTSCGSDSNSCPDVGGCGGNIVGSWTIDNACLAEGVGTAVSSNSLMSFCTQASVSSSGLKLTGSLTYNADGTYSESAQLTGQLTLDLPAACLTLQGVTVTCQQFNQSTAQSTPSPPATSGTSNPSRTSISPVTCGSSLGGGCTCTTSLQQDVVTGGIYSTQNNMLTQTGSAATEYCVQGDTLFLRSPTQTTTTATTTTMMGAMGAMAQVNIGSRAVLIRKK